MMRRLCFWLCLVLSAGGLHAQELIRIGILADRPPEILERRWQALAGYLEQAMPGQRVELAVLDNVGLLQAVSRNDLDFVIASPMLYLRIRESSALVRVVATLERTAGNLPLPAGGGVIVRLREREDIGDLQKIKGRRVAAVGREFLAGYLAQAEALASVGIRQKDFRLEATGMPYDRVLDALLSGSADVGFLPTGLLEDLEARRKIDAGRLIVLGKQQMPGFPLQISTRLYPEWAVVALQRPPHATVNKFASALFALDARHPAAKAAGINGFAVPADYTAVEHIARQYKVVPFEQDPPIPWHVLWEQQRQAIAIAATLFAALLALAMVLAVGRRRQAVLAERLAEQGETLRHIVQSVPGAVYRYRLVGGERPELLYVSPQLEILWGVSAESAMRDPAILFHRIHPDDLPGFMEADRQAASSGIRFVRDFRVCLPDGRMRWLHAESDPVDDAHYGRTYFGYVQDITARKEVEADLERALAHKSATLAAVPDLLFEFDLQGNYHGVWAHNADQLFTGQEKLIGRNVREVLPDAAARVILAALGEADAAGASSGQEIFLPLPHGGRWFELSTARKYGEAGQTRFIMLSRDVTERHQSTATLRRLARVFEYSAEAIMVLDVGLHILDVNPAFTLITGYSRDKVLGRHIGLLQVGEQFAEERMRHEVAESLQVRGHWRGELAVRRNNGEHFAAMLSLAAVRDEEEHDREYVAIFSDISRQKAHERELDLLANYDVLTGLPNRHLLADRMQSALAHAQREQTILAVCFLDLDGFKELNDTRGHEAGDVVLRQISRHLQSSLRTGDTVARLGGDEFVLLLTSLRGLEEILPALNRVLEAASRPVDLHGEAVSLSASIGVTVYPSDASDADTLVRHADQAMYRAKEMGKNRFCFFDTENARRLTLQQESLKELEKALHNREFVLFYQPKVALADGRVIGAEALIRWRHPVRGLLPPAAFLPALEGSALELAFSEWVMETALAQLVAWQQAGLRLGVSINLSAAHLLQPDFAESLAALLARYPKVIHNSYEIEILESAAISDVDLASVVLETVCRQGVSVSLDDFGTGYSSLTYFRRLPVQTLKIDQAFVRDMLNDSDDRGIVDTVIRLSKVFGRTVIAEGVETLEHWAALREMGCDHGQGYGIARPMPAEDFMAWLSAWQVPELPRLD